MKYFYTLLLICFTGSSFAQLATKEFPFKQNKEEQTIKITKKSFTQADEVWYEDFRFGLGGNNNSTDPQWSVGDSDGALWEADTDGSNGNFTGEYALESTSAANGWMIFDCDLSNTPFNAALVQERSGQLISPYINLSGYNNLTLSFEHSFRWCCSNNHLMMVGVSNDNGASWTEYQVNASNIANQFVSTTTTEIIISDVAGNQDSVQIRFDWSNGEETASHYYWMIDDVRIFETPDNYSNLVESYFRFPSSWFGGTSYTLTPKDQVVQTAYFFGGVIENLGVNTLDSAKIYSEVINEGFNSNSYGSEIITADRDTLFCNSGYTPADTGLYTAHVYGSDNNQVQSQTDTLSFRVSEYEYGRDRAAITGGYSGGSYINSEGSEQRGNVFDIYADANVYGIRAYIHPNTTSGATAKAILNMRDTATGEFIYLSESPVLNVGSMTNQWVNFKLSADEAVTAGQILVPTIQSDFNGIDTLVLANSGISSPGETMLEDQDGVQGDPGTWYYTNSTVMVRLSFDPQFEETVGIQNETISNISIYPNPNNGVFKIVLDEKYENARLKISNILGQEVFTQNLNHFDKRFNISANRLKSGVYTIELLNNSTSIETKKIIIR